MYIYKEIVYIFIYIIYYITGLHSLFIYIYISVYIYIYIYVYNNK